MANEKTAIQRRTGADAQAADSSRADEDALRLSQSSRCSVVLPAGAGKTQLIAKAVLHNSRGEGRQLILTHTHAGLAALKDRLRRLGVPGRAYRILTLDGFALRFTRHYPILASTRVVEPENGRDWEEVRQGAASALRSKHLRRVLRESFSGVYVDEYQDCGVSQHHLVLLLAEELPTRAVGDPLQGIFSFDDSVDWRKDVAVEFPRLSVSEIAWRWKTTNPRLGERLLQIRRCLINGEEFTLHPGDVIAWRRQQNRTQVEVCHDAAQVDSEVVALHKWAGQCHGLAKKLNGSYTSMEELAGRDLVRAAEALDEATGAESAIELIEFAKKCQTRLPQGLTAAQQQYRKGKRPRTHAGRKHREVYEALNSVADDPSPALVLQAMTEIDTIPDSFTHRRECWREMKRALRIRQNEPGVTSLREAVLRVRDRTRRTGRVPQLKAISRTLLVKGLEYDHCIVLNADDLKDARELYVALTRGRSSVTVLSPSRKISRPPVLVE